MLSKPLHGWTEITIGNFVGHGSYIQDIPVIFLEAFIRALACNTPAEIVVDEEGSMFTLRSHRSTTISARRAEEEIFFFNIDSVTLAKELLKDLQESWHEWLEWPSEVRLASEKEKSSYLKSRNTQLIRLTHELKKHL